MAAKQLITIKKMNFKHPIIIRTNKSKSSLDFVVDWLNENTKSKLSTSSIQNQTNIALINREGESIKIKTVRDIKEQLAFAAYQANLTRFVVFLDAHLLTIPAQNALLKTIEEPPENTQILFVTSMPEKLLETIRSRCQLATFGYSKTPELKDNSKIQMLYLDIISASMGQRIIYASNFKEREEALQVCNQLVRYLHSELKNNESKLLKKHIVKNISRILETINQLEHNVNVLLALENCFFELI